MVGGDAGTNEIALSHPTLTLIPVVASVPDRCPIMIRLPSGLGIEVASGFDAALLSAVVHAPQRTPPC